MKKLLLKSKSNARNVYSSDGYIYVADTFGVSIFQIINNKLKFQVICDLNKNGIVDIFDLALVGKNFGSKGTGLVGDVNNDGTVDILDLVIMGQSFGEDK